MSVGRLRRTDIGEADGSAGGVPKESARNSQMENFFAMAGVKV